MPVNPSENLLFEQIEQQNENTIDEEVILEIDSMREGAKLFMQYAGPAADVVYEERFVPARDDHQIPIRIYNPQADASKPVFIMYPGCGFILDLFESNAIAASRIAKYADIKVIIVNFRLCPEVTMPVPVYDAYDATKYIATHSDEFTIDPNNIFIGGVSSGAHATANIASMSRYDDELTIKRQILVNGCYDLTQSHHEYDAYEAEDKICQRGPVMDFMLDHYGLSKADYAKAPYSPLFEEDVSQMPNTTFLIAEYDGVRNDSEAYYQHLKSQNQNVEYILLPGQTHNTIIMRGGMTDGEDPAKIIATRIISAI